MVIGREDKANGNYEKWFDYPLTNASPKSASGQITDEAAIFADLSPSGRLIGIDPGTKTFGLALSDVHRSVASPLETIRRVKFSADVARLLELASEHQISGWVVGLPLNLDGSSGPRAQATKAFARNLAERNPLPILLWDERLSTVTAERVLLEADTSRRRRGALVDKVAAGIILQVALDRLARL